MALRGQIVTFYSYKGGVGRSFAMANVGAALAAWGYRVLCIDWDLEAPGLGHYLGSGKPHAGLVDLVGGLVESGLSHPWRQYVETVAPGGGATVDLIAAGRGDAQYIAQVQRLRWDELYEQHGLAQALEQWRESWRAEYDFVLVDSRTGITDTSAICTAHLPDVLIALFTANRQSLDGCVDVIERAHAARRCLPFDRSALHVLPVPARFDAKEEYRRAQEWQAMFVERMGQFLASWIEPGVPQSDIISRLTIPYVAYWSFGEGLPVLEEQARSPGTVRFALETIAALVAQRLANARSLLDGAEGYIQTAERAARRVGGYEADVLLGTTEDLVGFGRELMAALTLRGLQSREIAPPDRAPAVIEAEELASAQHAVFLIGAEFSPFIDGELRRLTKQMLDEPEGRIVIPVVLTRSAMRHLPALLQRMALQVEAEISVESLADRIVAELRPEHRRARVHTASPPTKPAPPERADVRQAIGRLKSPNPRMRQVAVAMLVRSGGLDHLTALVSCLSDDDVRVREEARKGVLEIVSLARQSDPEFRLNETILPTPVEPLSQVGVGELLALAGEERGLDLLFSHVDHTDTKVRVRVAMALGLVGGPGIVDWLGVLTEDPKEEVVGAALVGMIKLLGKLTPEVLAASKRLSRYTLQRLGVASAIVRAHPGPQPVFLNSLNGLLGNDLVDEIVESMLTEPANELVKDWILERVRSGDLQEMHRATEAVAKYSEPRLVEILVERMQAAFGEARIQLVRALGASRMKEALAPLGEVLVDPEPPVRLAAIEALSKLSTRDATSMLEPMLGDPMPSVRRGALNAIARLGGPKAAEAGRRFLKDESPDMRLAAIRAITSSPLPADVELLAASTDDDYDRVRSAAIAALSEIAHPSSVSVLQRSLGDSTSTVRRAALRGLVRIARLTLLERRLLTHAVDGDAPWLDVMEPITQDWLVRAAERVNLTPSAIRIRLEGLNRVLGVSLLLPPVIDDPQTASPN